MPITEQTKQTIEDDEKDSHIPTVRKPASKAAGTRMGIFQDWREGSTTEKARRCNALRDGR